MTTDTTLALNYARKALEKDLEYNNLRRLPYIYMNLSLLTKGDSARYYLEKSLEYFDDWGDEIAKCKYAWWHIDELHPDTIIAYAKPCYDSISYAGYARILAEAYLRKGNPDSALIYIDAIGKHYFFKADYSFYNSRRLDLLGEYKEASENWEEAYKLLKKDALFMFNQRLGAINAEYDLLNEKLENEKEKLIMMKVYVVTLLILVVGLLIAIVVIFRYKRNIGVLEVDIEKRKERFNTLFERYKDGYEVDRDKIFDDVRENLQVLNKDYPKLTKTDLAIVWLVFMNCDRDMMCKMLNISSRYYYNRRSIIQKVLGIQLDDSEVSRRQIERLIKKYISEKIKR
jgi:tetratricopeptide (TPR) repeat protein